MSRNKEATGGGRIESEHTSSLVLYKRQLQEKLEIEGRENKEENKHRMMCS